MFQMVKYVSLVRWDEARCILFLLFSVRRGGVVVVCCEASLCKSHWIFHHLVQPAVKMLSSYNTLTLKHSNPPLTTKYNILHQTFPSCFKQSEILVEQGKAMLTSELILLENLTKDFIPFFPNQFPAKFDIICVRWEGRGERCGVSSWNLPLSRFTDQNWFFWQIRQDAVVLHWGRERVGQSGAGAKYGRDQRY